MFIHTNETMRNLAPNRGSDSSENLRKVSEPTAASLTEQDRGDERAQRTIQRRPATVSISVEARQAYADSLKDEGDESIKRELETYEQERAEAARRDRHEAYDSSAGDQGSSREQPPRDVPSDGEQMDEDTLRLLRKLSARDREVRAHEQAHKSVGAKYVVSGPHFDFERGPDGKLYAVGGHVNLDTAPIPNDPEATVEKMRVIQRAALAPAEPSAQDQRVAAKAGAQRSEAERQLALDRQVVANDDVPSADEPSSAQRAANENQSVSSADESGAAQGSKMAELLELPSLSNPSFFMTPFIVSQRYAASGMF